jgi:hypothetical protein
LSQAVEGENPFKFCINIQGVAHREEVVFFRETSQLMLSTEIRAVYCDSPTQDVKAWFGKLESFDVPQQVVQVIGSGLQRINC